MTVKTTPADAFPPGHPMRTARIRDPYDGEPWCWHCSEGLIQGRKPPPCGNAQCRYHDAPNPRYGRFFYSELVEIDRFAPQMVPMPSLSDPERYARWLETGGWGEGMVGRWKKSKEADSPASPSPSPR